MRNMAYWIPLDFSVCLIITTQKDTKSLYIFVCVLLFFFKEANLSRDQFVASVIVKRILFLNKSRWRFRHEKKM